MQEMQETRAPSLGWEDILEEQMETNSSILAWKIPQTEEPGGLQSMGLQRVRDDLAHMHLTTKILQKYLVVMKLFYILIVVVITVTHIKKYFISLYVNYTSISNLRVKLCLPPQNQIWSLNPDISLS